jgi:hypothetical protein
MEVAFDLVRHTYRTGESTYLELHPAEFGASVAERWRRLEEFLLDCATHEVGLSLTGSRAALAGFGLKPGVVAGSVTVLIGHADTPETVRVIFSKRSRPRPEADFGTIQASK